MTELLVNISMRFPATVDPFMLSRALDPVVRAAVAAGGLTTNISVQPHPLPVPLPEADRSPSSGSVGEEASSLLSPLRSVAPHAPPPPARRRGSDRDA